MPAMRIFLDANVLFSAASSNGAVRELLQALVRRGDQLVAHAYVVAEARRNLVLKAARSVEALDEVLDNVEIADVWTKQPGQCSVDLAWLHEKDRPVLEAAIAQRCDALLTGDRRHFGAAYGQTFAGVTVHSPSSFARSLP